MKTTDDFDYDLWTDGGGNCFSRVKATGEVCQISREVMRLLQRERKRQQREKLGVPVYGFGGKRATVIDRENILSLDCALEEGMEPDCGELVDKVVAVSQLEIQFQESLTEKQRHTYIHCMIKGVSHKEYAVQQGITSMAVTERIKGIRKKAKNFFDVP